MSIPWTLRLVLMLTLPPLLWAGNSVIGRLLVVQYPPLALNAVRWWLACGLLLPLGWRVLRQRQALRERWVYFCTLGFLGVGCYNALQYAALQTSTALNVTLIAASMPVWMLLLGALFYGVRPRAMELLGAALSITGVAVVISRGQWAVLRHVTFSGGDLLMLLAVTVWALYSWMLVRPPMHMQGPQRLPWNWAELLLPQVMFGMVWAGLAAGIEATYWLPPALPGPGLDTLTVALCLIYVAVGPSILAFRFWGLGVSIVGPANAAFFANLTPVFTAVLSAGMLGETPHAYHALAFGLIGAGIGVSAWRRRPTDKT
jgi:drug/metabolite transporter (DMT)-like permease